MKKKVDKAEPLEEAETAENACFYRLKKAKQRQDKFPRPVAGGIPARVPAESEAVQGRLSALGDRANSLDRSPEAYPPGSLPKVRLCGEVCRLQKEGKSRGWVQRKHPLKENERSPIRINHQWEGTCHGKHWEYQDIGMRNDYDMTLIDMKSYDHKPDGKYHPTSAIHSEGYRLS
jgi:hypothetical protein